MDAAVARGTSLDRLRQHVVGLLSVRTGEPAPQRFLMYVDQGKELYARSGNEQRDRFSSLIAEAASRPEFQILLSLRSDYNGRLTKDETLSGASERVHLPPMSVEGLTRALEEPARRLDVKFEPANAARRLAELGAPQSGALPLLSYLMTDIWREMQKRDDGILKWSQRTDLIDVGYLLSVRADDYIAGHPTEKEATRALLTLCLAHVPAVGEPVRRRALKHECTAQQWRIVESLSSQEWRLLTVSEDERTHEPTVEVAHEQLLRSWGTLRDWLSGDRDFLIWKGTLEQARLDWLGASKADNALLMGRSLIRAQDWQTERRVALGVDELSFIEASEQREVRVAQEKRRASQLIWLVTIAAVVVLCGSWFQVSRLEATRGELELQIERLTQQKQKLARSTLCIQLAEAVRNMAHNQLKGENNERLNGDVLDKVRGQ